MSRPGTLTVYRWELRKLRAQKRTYLGLGAAVLVPIVFSVAVAIQPGEPADVPFGRYINDTGLAFPLVTLLFGSIWFYPLIAALVSGDIVANEDHGEPGHDTTFTQRGHVARHIRPHVGRDRLAVD